MVVLTRSLNHISYMQIRRISYIGKVEVFSSALIPGACVRGWGKHSAWMSTAFRRRTSRTQSGRSPNPLTFSLRKEKVSQKKRTKEVTAKKHVRKEKTLSRKQTETLTIRLTTEEKMELQKKMYEAVSPSMRDFILKMCRDGKIIVNEELRELNRELKYQGNNLNQLTRLAHQNRFSSADLSQLLSVYRKILAALGGQNNGGR